MKGMENPEELSFIPTRSSRLKQNSEHQFQSVVYKSYKKKSKPLPDTTLTPEIDLKDNELNMKRARHEIIKLGISGFDGKRKHDAKVQLAIRLGAKPKKNRHMNYKRLQEKRKQEKKKAEKEQALNQLGKNKLGFSNAKGKTFDKKRKKNNGLLESYGKASYKLKQAIEGKK